MCTFTVHRYLFMAKLIMKMLFLLQSYITVCWNIFHTDEDIDLYSLTFTIFPLYNIKYYVLSIFNIILLSKSQKQFWILTIRISTPQNKYVRFVISPVSGEPSLGVAAPSRVFFIHDAFGIVVTYGRYYRIAVSMIIVCCRGTTWPSS